MFDAALKEMGDAKTKYWGPQSFYDYCKKEKLKNARTAQYISIDRLSSLHKSLKKQNCMVLRLGIPSGEKHTHFGIVQCLNGWEDYFLIDEYLFKETLPELFIPSVSSKQLFPFTLLPAFTETSLVNLALASGLMAYALGIENQALPLAPATGQSTFSFDFKPRKDMSLVWSHSKGQVEIDSLFTAKRDGKETVFVVECKTGANHESLAKHKLLYPVLAISTKVPPYMPIVPVYIRVITKPDGYHFYFCECKVPKHEKGQVPILSEMKPVSQKQFVLRIS